MCARSRSRWNAASRSEHRPLALLRRTLSSSPCDEARPAHAAATGADCSAPSASSSDPRARTSANSRLRGARDAGRECAAACARAPAAARSPRPLSAESLVLAVAAGVVVSSAAYLGGFFGTALVALVRTASACRDSAMPGPTRCAGVQTRPSRCDDDRLIGLNIGGGRVGPTDGEALRSPRAASAPAVRARRAASGRWWSLENRASPSSC
jgi:hypothetical protein